MSKHHRKRKSKGAHSRSQSIASTVDDRDDDDGPLYGIKTSHAMGRYMVARRDLMAGDVIMSEQPLVVGPCAGGGVQCLGCYKNLEDGAPHVRCAGCGWPMCSARCAGLDAPLGHTRLECTTLHTADAFAAYDLGALRPLYSAVVPLRCLLLKTSNQAAFAAIAKMESHSAIRRNIAELWATNQRQVVDRIVSEWGFEQFDCEEVHRICGVLEVNCFEIGQQGVNIRGLYPTAFLMSHDCVPNTNHTDVHRTYTLTVRASIAIKTGQPITLSYAYTLQQSTLKRREHLLENKFFECRCRRCADPTELGTFSGAVICPKCRTGLVLSTDPLDPAVSWSCTTPRTHCPGYSIAAKSMELLINRITAEVDGIDSNDVETMETFLQKYRNVLHPTHYLCLGVKLSLSQLYGKINGYLIHELSDELLERKRELCEEVVRVFDTIEPGYTRIRGVTLYELHAPIMVTLTRQFAEQKFTKAELRARLRRVVRCLEEAAVILSYEPSTSPEGIMGGAAHEALEKVKDWEKIVGKI